jgi:cell wall-associated NlpC family hydrolase
VSCDAGLPQQDGAPSAHWTSLPVTTCSKGKTVLSLRALASAAAFAVFVAAAQTHPAAAHQSEAVAVPTKAVAVPTKAVAVPTKAAAVPTKAAAVATNAVKVENFAEAQLSKPYRLGADGMRRFDCSGLVYRTYFETGLVNKISGRQLRARGYYHWFKDHGLLTRDPHPGDLVVWAHRHQPVSHIGIFVGYNKRGKAMAISALVNPYGVTRHRVNWIHIPVKAYLRVDLGP